MLGLGSIRRACRVAVPAAATLVLTAALLSAGGQELGVFHLVALLLVLGIGLNYALFFERPVPDQAEARRTLHATLVCVAAALLVFGMQALSSLPVLRAIGLTVALGVGFHFCLSILMPGHSDAGTK